MFLSSLCLPVGEVIIRQSLSLLHLFKFFAVRQICKPVLSFSLYSICVRLNWKWPNCVPTCWEFASTECWNGWRPPWWDYPCLRGLFKGYMSVPIFFLQFILQIWKCTFGNLFILLYEKPDAYFHNNELHYPLFRIEEENKMSELFVQA